MAKPEVKPQQPLKPRPPTLGEVRPAPDPGSPATFKRLRLVRLGNDSYALYEDTYSSQPSSSRMLHGGLKRFSAIYWVKLWLEEFIGPNRTGDTGL